MVTRLTRAHTSEIGMVNVPDARLTSYKMTNRSGAQYHVYRGS